MTITSTPRTAGPFTATGSSQIIAFEFRAFGAAPVRVESTDPDTGIITVLEPGIDYTLALNSNQQDDPGGDITLTRTAGHTIVIIGMTEAVQGTQFASQGGNWPQAIEGGMDRLTAIAQEQGETLGRAVLAPIGESPWDTGDLIALREAAEGAAAASGSSATASAASAVAAASSAGSSAGSAADAATSAMQAGISAGSASTNLSLAIIARADAVAAAVAAEGSASAAATSESSASASESGAAASASAASDSAVAAAGSAEDAGELLADFLSRYLGPHASDAAANDAHPARPVGALYWNTAASNLRVWGGSGWVVVATPSGDYLPLDGSAPMTGNLDLGGQHIVTSADGNHNIDIVPSGTGRVRAFVNNALQVLLGASGITAINYLRLFGGAGGGSVGMDAQGSDTNINVNITPKGSGVVSVGNHHIALVSDPAADHHAANRRYVDSLIGPRDRFMMRLGANVTGTPSAVMLIPFDTVDFDTAGICNATSDAVDGIPARGFRPTAGYWRFILCGRGGHSDWGRTVEFRLGVPGFGGAQLIRFAGMSDTPTDVFQGYGVWEGEFDGETGVVPQFRISGGATGTYTLTGGSGAVVTHVYGVRLW